ncbi:hypothetical protein L596_004651 [Steinernema carpocapsae]|uniref:Uncharacterized protein n=1 Tax=Steinernema carpocapsae TaxID=34508 RepID=A0A4U8UWL9_STECR|nr:hypothetical protein L596_004651 [Steinernema carpocapsae]
MYLYCEREDNLKNCFCSFVLTRFPESQTTTRGFRRRDFIDLLIRAFKESILRKQLSTRQIALIIKEIAVILRYYWRSVNNSRTVVALLKNTGKRLKKNSMFYSHRSLKTLI